MVVDAIGMNDIRTWDFEEGLEVIAVRLDAPPGVEAGDDSTLSDNERVRAARFVFARDRDRFVTCRAVLRTLLGDRLGVSPHEVALTKGPSGKPELGAPFTRVGLRFNVSHCGDLAAFAFARDREVGIDVEALRRVPDAHLVAARFFSAFENEEYDRLDPSEQPLGFFNCWTRKEAFVKAIGDGLSHPLRTFDVSLAPGDRPRVLRIGTAPGADCGWNLYAFSPAPGYVGACVVRSARSGARQAA